MQMHPVLYAFLQFAFFYPLVMAFMWMVGGLYYFFRRERKARDRTDPPPMASYPFATILIPCHNEADNLEDTLNAALSQNYPDYEVIAINDGSRDEVPAWTYWRRGIRACA